MWFGMVSLVLVAIFVGVSFSFIGFPLDPEAMGLFWCGRKPKGHGCFQVRVFKPL